VPNIEAYNPLSRYIVLLRNPIDMAPALHAEAVFTGVEPVAEFSSAWALQDRRRAGADLPRNMLQPRRLLYGDACRLGAQLSRLYERVPRGRVLTLLQEDMRKDARGTYLRVLQFLGLPDDGRQTFPALNASKARAFPGISALTSRAYRLKSALGIQRSFGLLNRVDDLTSVAGERAPLTADLRLRLTEHFSDDVALLSRLIGRDLHHWTNTATRAKTDAPR
jgi:hypothetical protein